MTLCRAAVQDVLIQRLQARRGLHLQLSLQDRTQRLIVPQRQVPPLGLPPSDPVAKRLLSHMAPHHLYHCDALRGGFLRRC